MSNKFLSSMSNAGYTANGASTNLSSSNACVDLFFQIGSMRSASTEDLCVAWTKAFIQDADIALKTLFWARDIRAGAGERRSFRIIMRHIAERQPELLTERLIALIPQFGRWDDLLVFFNTDCESFALKAIGNALKSEDSLCAKWMPREKSSKYLIARKIREYMEYSPKQYRKMLSSLSSVVETKMCADQWDEIEFSHVPSQAMRIYKRAFENHAPQAWSEYTNALSTGASKVNAGAIHPHEILAKYITTSSYNQYSASYGSTVCEISKVTEAQWAALPNWLEGNTSRILPIVDTSSSMGHAYSDSSKTRPIDVSVSLGMYIAERNSGPFKDYFVTFSENPMMHHIKGKDLSSRLASVCSSEWGMNTNIEGTFNAILHHATSSGATVEDMPTTILILSDMEFDTCASINETAMQSIRRQYNEAGFELPNIVFWNLNARMGNVPVRFDEQGTAMVSGFSPAIMKSLLTDTENFTPEAIMRATVCSELYSEVCYE